MAEALSKGPVTVTMGAKSFLVLPDMAKLVVEDKKISVAKYIPSVIEPSFGIGRVLYGLLEHSYVVKEKNGQQQAMLALKPLIAPFKVGLCPFDCNPAMQAVTSFLEDSFVQQGFTTKTDTSGASIGKKYARMDEIGVPFAIAIDFESAQDSSVTIRDRDVTTQIRVSKELAVTIVVDLIRGLLTWSDACGKYPRFASPADSDV